MGPVSKSATHLLVLIASVFALASQPGAQVEQGKVGWVEGELAPPLRLPTIDGEQTINLHGLVGTPILLIEFASW